MTITSSFNTYIGKKMDRTATTWFAKSLDKGLKHPAEYAAKMMVLSLITKDTINCGLYTYQSLHNDKIPEDKRGFVASLDLFNGILNVGGQLAAFALVERFLLPKWEGKIYSGVLKNLKTNTETVLTKSKAHLHPDTVHNDTLNVYKENLDLIAKKLKEKGSSITLEKLEKSLPNISDDLIKKVGHAGSKGKDLATGFKIIVTALATTALIKRTLTPLIATPLAAWRTENQKLKAAHKNDIKDEPILNPAMIDSTMAKVDAVKINSTKEKFNKTA